MVGNGEQNDSTMYAEREWRGGVSLPFRYPSQQPFRSRMPRLPLYDPLNAPTWWSQAHVAAHATLPMLLQHSGVRQWEDGADSDRRKDT
ncbi:hypothetical protein BHM03_00033208 [Ensete ventricosum]|nr:hypothetical protein BHM03_00033208 [Ensete ventricosum]